MNLFNKIFGKSGTTGFSPGGISGNSGFGNRGSSGTAGFGMRGSNGTFGHTNSGVFGSSGTAGTAGFPMSSDYWIKFLKNEKNQEMSGGKLRVFDKKGYLLFKNNVVQITTTYDNVIQSFDDKPAVEYTTATYWFNNNQLHRENGPSVMATTTDFTADYLNDVRVTMEERLNVVRSKRLEKILDYE